MLTCSCFCDDAGFAHFFCEHNLPENVINFVASCMVEFFTLEVDACFSAVFGESRSEVERRGSSDVALTVGIHFSDEVGIIFEFEVSIFDLEDEGHEGFGDVSSSEVAESSIFIGERVV